MGEKKGVSPLIATVLLVGLVVLIAMIIFFWYGNYLSEFLEKQGVDLEASCVQDVEIYLSEVGCDSSGESSVVTFYVENVGDMNLKGLNILYSTSSSAGNITKSKIIHQAVGTYMEAIFNQNFGGVSVDLEFVPIIGSASKSKHCEGVAQYATIVC